MFILAEARAGSSGSEVLGLEQLGSQRLRRGPGQLGWQAVLGASSSRALESVFGLGLTAAELVLRPGVLQLQLPLLSLMNQIRDLVFPPLLACWLFTFLLLNDFMVFSSVNDLVIHCWAPLSWSSPLISTKLISSLPGSSCPVAA